MLGYRFAMQDVALRIGHERCPPVEVTLEPWQFVVSAVGRRAVFGLCEMDHLADHVCAELERERRAGVKRLPLCCFVTVTLTAHRFHWLLPTHAVAVRISSLLLCWGGGRKNSAGPPL